MGGDAEAVSASVGRDEMNNHDVHEDGESVGADARQPRQGERPVTTKAVRPRRLRRWILRGLATIGILLVLLVATFWWVGGFSMIARSRPPSTPFAAVKPPPAPDYAAAKSWLALPGGNGLERSTAPGTAAINEADAPADVFFIHPTTYKVNGPWNAPFDASDKDAPLNQPVLLDQVSVFNGCCLMYAPRYRQATLGGLSDFKAIELAYGDVARAFRYYLEHQNKGRPFIIASHSQGTAHAIKLLQEEVLGKPLQSRLVAAYLIGGYVPDTFGEVGLPICDSAYQTGCVISYNASEAGRTGAQMISKGKKIYWWKGERVTNGQSNALCVNPLNWSQKGAAPASANGGSLPFPVAPFGTTAKPLPGLAKNLTGAECRDGLLDVDVPWSAPPGFTDLLS
ncbi:MAG: DUF3089 domain-containing protein, partial [Alphaproteobacteria bacterium]